MVTSSIILYSNQIYGSHLFNMWFQQDSCDDAFLANQFDLQQSLVVFTTSFLSCSTSLLFFHAVHQALDQRQVIRFLIKLFHFMF